MIVNDSYLKKFKASASKVKDKKFITQRVDRNLWLRVSTTSGYSSFIYRVSVKNTQKDTWYTIGEYPIISLTEAREKAFELRRIVNEGISPYEHYKQEANKNITVGQVFQEFLQTAITRGIANNTLITLQSFERLYLKPCASLMINALTPEIVRTKVINPLIQQNKLIQARQVMGYYKQLSKFAYQHEYTETNILDRLCNDFVVPNVRDRILSKDELAKLIRWCKLQDKSDGYYLYLALLLGTRKVELANLQWNNVNLVDRTILITNTKNKQDLLIKLPDEVFNLIMELYKIKNNEYVFASVGGTKNRRIEVLIMNCIKDCQMDKWTAHDLRRTFSSCLADLGFDLELIDFATNHKLSGVRSNYIHTTRIEERCQMVLSWFNYLEIVNGKKSKFYK